MNNNVPVYIPSSFENIDSAILNWVDNILNISVNTHEGVQKINVNFAIAERSALSKRNKDLRDSKYTLKYPVIAIVRGDIDKPNKKNAALQGTAFKNASTTLVLPVYSELNHDKTSDRANADAKRFAGTINVPRLKTNRPIYNVYSIPIPSFVEVKYEISCISNFQQQMNEILNPFVKYSSNINGFKLLHNGHGYEVTFDEKISNSSNLDDISDTERIVEYSFNLTVKGYVHHGDANDKGPTVIRQETRPEIVFKTELVYTGSF